VLSWEGSEAELLDEVVESRLEGVFEDVEIRKRVRLVTRLTYSDDLTRNNNLTVSA
jgi:hypothetical protein